MPTKGCTQAADSAVRHRPHDGVAAEWRILASIATGSRRLRDKVYKLCRFLGVRQKAVQALGESVTVYLVCGPAEAVLEFVRRACPLQWCYALTAARVYRATGVGDKVKRQPHPMDWRFELLREADDEADAEMLSAYRSRLQAALIRLVMGGAA